MMAYLIVFIALLVSELIYFKIADRFNIIDKPNQRSSHTTIVLRGGGNIFTIALLIYFFTHQFSYPWFILGLVTVAAISFADDIKHKPSLLRLILQMISISILLYQLYVMDLYLFNWVAIIIAFAIIVFLMNAYNFMDGINGITSGYSFTVLSALFYLNQQLQIFDRDIIIYLAIGNLVFFIFNFKPKAKTFAGDVGSIGMAFALLFFAGGIIFKTGSVFFILLFAVYCIDAGFTIIYRLLKKENIFKAHRQHVYQYLASEKQLPQLLVSTIYVAAQTIISIGVCLLWQKKYLYQLIFTVIVLGCLALLYILAKRSIFKAR